MTTSAACGSPEQQSRLIETSVVVPCLRSCRKPTSASLRMWCEHVDWLIPSSSPISPTVISPDDVASACSRRTRVGSAKQANHSA